MNKIQFDRTSFDGSNITLRDIEVWYDKDNELSDKNIKKEMEGIHHEQEKVNTLLQEITNNIHSILLLSPVELEKWAVKIDNEYPNVFSKRSANNRIVSTELGKQVLKAFNYDNYRKNKLVDLAKKLNVKSCPYCNMHYTLYAEEGATRTDQLARFQFDHFFSKNKYPMLSMSLYNLIPSCALCNQGKSDKRLPLSFHPYYSDICKQFKFELDNPIGLYSGQKISDHIDVNIVATSFNQSEVDEFAQTFHLKALYQRHGDIAQEIFDKAYEYPYYSHPENFKWLSNRSTDYIKRLWMGTYPDEKDIEKRPMTKFIQDLWEQAVRNKLPVETVK